MKIFLVRGVPASIQRDSWWMDGPIHPRPNPENDDATGPQRWERPLLLVALVALADLLMWDVAPGLSMAVFGLCLLLAALAYRGGRGWGGLLTGAALMLPLVEEAQLLSLLFWMAGLLLGGTWIALGGWPGVRGALIVAIRLLGLGPMQVARNLRAQFAGSTPCAALPDKLGGVILGWALPIGLGLVFLSLLYEANPVLEHWLIRLEHIDGPGLARIAFWGGMALMIWPFLRLTVLQGQLSVAQRHLVYGPRRLPAVLNAPAVRRSLILFNLLFAVQTGMDATYLWGGVSLPDGMTYAEYAHHGAYPLLATALLAGAFALAARPFTDTDRMLRLSLMIWIGQTVLLVISSLLRLELYVEIYGLTRLRLSAGIWMGVVATGLMLTMWQVLHHRSAAWLLKRCALLGAVTLYACMFVSFDRTIAHYNLTHDVPRDTHYICQLGSAALPEIRRHAPDLCDAYYGPYVPLIANWREWGFRDWRVLRSLAALNATPADI